MKILHLTVKKCWFDLIVGGGKHFEYRRPSAWMASRLVDRLGRDIRYDVVRFRDGYSRTARTVDVRYNGYRKAEYGSTVRYPNGLTVDCPAGAYIIMLGGVVCLGVERHVPPPPQKIKN